MYPIGLQWVEGSSRIPTPPAWMTETVLRACRGAAMDMMSDPESHGPVSDPVQGPRSEANATKRIAIIGGGMSGVAAFWALRNSDHTVDLYEREDKLSGFMQSVQGGRTFRDRVHLDKRFVNYFPSCSPNLVALFNYLGISSTYAPCSFSVSVGFPSFNMSFDHLTATASRIRDWLQLDRWVLSLDIQRFHYFAPDLLTRGVSDECDFRTFIETESSPMQTVEDYLDAKAYSEVFLHDYLFPLSQILWNIESKTDLLKLPIQRVVGFLWTAGLLARSPVVCAIRPYGDAGKKVEKHFADRQPNKNIFLNARVVRVSTWGTGTHPTIRAIRMTEGPEERPPFSQVVELAYDYVILALHPEETLQILTRPSADENQILGSFRTTLTKAYLHSDSRFSTSGRTFSYINWMDWTALMACKGPLSSPSCITYRLNALPPSNCRDSPLCVTLNPAFPPEAESVATRWFYQTPVLNREALKSSKKLHSIQNVDGRYLLFCGSWTGYGSPEDAVRSAFQVAVKHLGAKLPFEIRDSFNGYLPIRHVNFWDRLARFDILLRYCLLSIPKACHAALPRWRPLMGGATFILGWCAFVRCHLFLGRLQSK